MIPTQLADILSQPFTYLTEGLQTFVYISKDGNYVLKTFKNLEQSKEQFLKWGLNPDEVTEDLIADSERSYRLAFEKLKDETALLYIHISNEDAPIQKITLDGREYKVTDLQFIVQEKVELVRDRIKKLTSEGDTTGIHKVIDDIFYLINSIWGKHITEDTFNWDHNYGYALSGKLIQIDVGTFYEGEKYLKEEIAARKLLQNVSYSWLGENLPNEVNYFQKKAEDLYNKSIS